MTDFKELAAQVKAEHDAKAAEQDSERAAINEAKMKRATAIANHLRTEVWPHLEKARGQFGENSILTKVVDESDVHSGRPFTKFKFLTPPRKSDRYQFGLSALAFESDGNVITVSLVDDTTGRASKEIGRSPPLSIEELVEFAMREALKIYYREWERKRHNW